MILISLVISVASAVAALVIDHSRESLSLIQLKNASDAAALAGARQLDGTIEGWRSAKRAAVLAVKNNPFHGGDVSEVRTLSLINGPRNFWDAPDTAHPGTSGRVGDFDIEIERGLFKFDPHANDDEGGFVFESLERDSDDIPDDGRIYGAVQSYLVANAVQVRLRLRRLNTNVGQVFGIKSFSDLTAESTARSDSQDEVVVAPIAVAYSSLIQDTNPFVTSGTHQMSAYDPESQYDREIVFSDANPKRNLEDWNGQVPVQRLAQREGITRYEWQRRLGKVDYQADSPQSLCFQSPIPGEDAITGQHPNCKTTAFFGVLGVPTLDGGRATDANELNDAFQRAAIGELKARVGMYLAPLEDIREVVDGPLASTVAQFINSGARTVSDTYHRRVSEYSTQWAAAPNAPHVRTVIPAPPTHDPELRIADQDDGGPAGALDTARYLRIAWPSDVFNANGNRVFYKILVDYRPDNPLEPFTRKPGQWVNEMCHDNGIPVDPDQARVREVYAMVVAPGVAYRGDGEQVMYSDPERLFASRRERATGIIAQTRPTIIGFVKVDLISLGLRDLDQQFAHTAVATSPWATEVTASPYYGVPGTEHYVQTVSPAAEVDQNPLLLSGESRVNEYREDIDRCKEGDELCEQWSEVAEADELFDQNILRCFDLRPVLAEFEELVEVFNSCFNSGIPDPQCFQNEGIFFRFFENLLNHNIAGLPNSNCYPQLRYNADNRQDPSAWTFAPRSAGCGCCGVRAKLTMMPPAAYGRTVWTSGKSVSDMRPTLVAEMALEQ